MPCLWYLVYWTYFISQLFCSFNWSILLFFQWPMLFFCCNKQHFCLCPSQCEWMILNSETSCVLLMSLSNVTKLCSKQLVRDKPLYNQGSILLALAVKEPDFTAGTTSAQNIKTASSDQVKRCSPVPGTRQYMSLSAWGRRCRLQTIAANPKLNPNFLLPCLLWVRYQAVIANYFSSWSLLT